MDKFFINRSGLSDEEIKGLGLRGPWFLEFDDGQVYEYETEEAARRASLVSRKRARPH